MKPRSPLRRISPKRFIPQRARLAWLTTIEESGKLAPEILMHSSRYVSKRKGRVVRKIAFVMLLLSLLMPTISANAKQAGTTDISIHSADIRTGQLLVGACYVLVDFSNEGCDENGDGQVDFADVPIGTYTVTQTRGPAGYMAPGNFPIVVEDTQSAVFAAFLIPEAHGAGVFDIAITPLVPFSLDEELPGACFLLYGGSEEGCDENNDNRVTFEDVRSGTYLVTETRAPDGYGAPDDFWISVTEQGARRFLIHQAFDNGFPDVSIISIDDRTDQLVVGACYVILDWSEEGCDENGDGHVDFAGVKPGTYMVTQTKSPAGFAIHNDFEITVRDKPGQQYPVRLSAATAMRDVVIVSRDAESGNRLVGACYIIDGASIEGCDENNDGQVDFADVFTGTFTVIETKAPTGYNPVLGTKITVTAANNDSVQLFSMNHRKR
jgi:uncharacterized surface anchored protein